MVGGGISGLAAAHRLTELARGGRPVDVTVLEAAQRIGGIISTVTREGFLLEEGPDAFITDKPWARDLAVRLGLESRLIATRPLHRRSFVVRKGRLLPIPDGFQMIAPTRFWPFAATRILSPAGKVRMLMDLVIPRGGAAADESLGDFVTRRLGREALERIAQPMIGGIYGADPRTLSLRATFPRFLQMEETHGSVIRAMLAARRRQPPDSAGSPRASVTAGPRYGLFASFDRGMSLLPESLAAAISSGGSKLRTGTKALSLSRTPSARWRVRSSGAGAAGMRESSTSATVDDEYDAVILALPATGAAALLRPVDPGLAAMLESIRHGSAATVSLAYQERDVGHPMDGFGFVVPSIERLSITAATFAQRKFPGRAPEGDALIRAFWSDAADVLADETIIGRTVGDLRTLIGIQGAPRFTQVTRYPGSMPHYQVGHLDLVESIESAVKRHEGLFLAGNAYRGVGIPDCIRSGETAASMVAAMLDLNSR